MKHRAKIYILLLGLGVAAQSTGIAQLQPAVADSFLNFILANKNKSSLFITSNDTTIAHLNEDVLMPLANVEDIMVAIEFAMQASVNMINKDDYVSVFDLDKYYVPNTDKGAQEAWLEYEKETNNIRHDSVSLTEVARGMTMFNSNANAEYLMDLLGFDNVKNSHQLFELQNHTALFPVVSSLFLYQNPMKFREGKVLKSIRSMTEEEYCRAAFEIHNQLKNNPSYKARFRFKELSPKMRKLWSDRLTASTTKEYVNLVKILNNRKFLNENAYGIIAEILEFPMEKKEFRDYFIRYGGKGGSSGYAFTQVIYYTSKSNERLEMAVFFNDLSTSEEEKLERWLYSFEAQLFFDQEFRKKLSF